MEEISLEKERIKSALESLIFTSAKPVILEDLKKIFRDMSGTDLIALIDTLQKEYEERGSGIRIVEIAGGYLMVTANQNASFIKEFYKIKNTERLSAPGLEALAIVAYKQPVTRIDVETIRGVSSDGVIRSLLEKNLLRIVGRKEVIGRPFVYGTTRFFLDYFGLKSLDELPKIEEFAASESFLHMKLASGDGDITPLDEEEQKQQLVQIMQSTPSEPQDDQGQPSQADISGLVVTPAESRPEQQT